MAAEKDEVGIWYDLSQEEFEQRVREFLCDHCGWPSGEPIPDIMCQAFVTRSFGNKDNGLPNNESLVFYGNAVLGSIISSELYRCGKYSPAMMSEAKNYMMFPNAYVVHLFDRGIDMRGLIRITMSRDKTNVDTKLNYLTARIGDCFEALIGALDLVGKRDLAVELVRRTLMEDALVHCDELGGLGDAEMRKRWKKITFQRSSRFKDLCDSLVVFED